MELTNDFNLDDVDGSISGPSSSGTEETAVNAIDNCSKQAEAFLERQGGKIHPIFNAEDNFLQQRTPPPRRHAFEYVMTPLFDRRYGWELHIATPTRSV